MREFTPALDTIIPDRRRGMFERKHTPFYMHSRLHVPRGDTAKRDGAGIEFRGHHRLRSGPDAVASNFALPEGMSFISGEMTLNTSLISTVSAVAVTERTGVGNRVRLPEMRE